MIRLFNRVIAFCFYCLFLITPLVFFADTSELFEFNKMWFTFILAILIVFCWISRMILEKQFRVTRTPLDIPILLFLASQFISTIFSLDSYVSWWGYYSRFNGGMLSLLTYGFLYFSFVSTVEKKYFPRYLIAALVGGIVSALWGLPAHFGYDPTCLIFRGSLDVSCWTSAFQPKVRIFSTLGQPDWLAAYLVALIPLAFYFSITFFQRKKYLISGIFFSSVILFSIDLLFTASKGGFVGFIISMLFLFFCYLWIYRKTFVTVTKKKMHFLFASIFIVTFLFIFFIGQPIPQLNIVTWSGLRDRFVSHTQSTIPTRSTAISPSSSGQEIGGTDSGIIRLLVWRGAIDAWQHYPVFGTGVETFAFAYYLYRPAAHNMTSEWDYLYNKAHNEYLNYLTTTGIAGLGTYMLMIGFFLFLATRTMLFRKEQTMEEKFFIAAMLAAYISILITNFFGFSVVIVNVFLFLFPAFVFAQTSLLSYAKEAKQKEISGFQWLGVTVSGLIALYLLFVLTTFWNADSSYALGQNFDGVGQYQTAYQQLHNAVAAYPAEPTFQNELALNDAILAENLVTTNATTASQLAQEGVQTSNNLVMQHPNDVVYWKNRVRILYSLGQLNPIYNQQALVAIQTAAKLAPTDAKIWYNYGILDGQTGNIQDAITILIRTTQLKYDYKDAYYALGLYYRQAAVDKNGKVADKAMEQRAVDEMNYILNHFGKDSQALAALKAWNGSK